MEILVGYLHQGLSFIVPLVILLGLLIFVHELGHFLVAKYYGVKVEVFSLGFGKKILKFQRGETEYCVSVVPFGGYVKMYGDDPSADVPSEMRERSFLHKAVGPRIAIVLAGPLMNFFFAILLFGLIAIVGEEFAQPVVGSLKADTAATTAGFKPGDTIKMVDGTAVRTWDEVQEKVEAKGDGEPVEFEVQRRGSDDVAKLRAVTKLVPNRNPVSTKSVVGEVEGLSNRSVAAMVGVMDPNSIAAKSGMRSGDEIAAIGETVVEDWDHLLFLLNRDFRDSSKKISPTRIEVLRWPLEARLSDKKQPKTQPEKMTISLEISGGFVDPITELARLGIERADLYISGILPDSAASEAQLRVGDRMVSLNGKKLEDWSELAAAVKVYKPSDAKMKVQIRREGKLIDLEIAPREVEQPTNTGHHEKTYALGVMAGIGYTLPKSVTIKTDGIFPVIVRGVRQTLHWTEITAVGFVKLVQNKVSAKSIGGPIMIGQLASKTFEIGLSPFLKIMAIISINLFVLNLLPIPVLDGGHLVFFTIEAIRGAPLSMRKIEIAQQVGLVLLMGLMLFALFNDVNRLFN